MKLTDCSGTAGFHFSPGNVLNQTNVQLGCQGQLVKCNSFTETGGKSFHYIPSYPVGIISLYMYGKLIKSLTIRC